MRWCDVYLWVPLRVESVADGSLIFCFGVSFSEYYQYKRRYPFGPSNVGLLFVYGITWYDNTVSLAFTFIRVVYSLDSKINS